MKAVRQGVGLSGPISSRCSFPKSAWRNAARWLVTLLFSLACFAWPHYDTQIAAAVKPVVLPSTSRILAGQHLVVRPTPSDTSWPPFVRIVPQVNSEDAMVYAEGIGRVYARLGADFGNTSHTWSHADLEYSEMEGLYRGLAERALSEPCSQPEGCLQLYAYTGGGSHPPATTIAYEFATVGPAAASDLELFTARLRFADPPFTDGVTHTVILQIPPKEPAPLPGGWRIIEGGLYEVESDGVDGQLRASLVIRYDPDWLDWYGIEPGDLRLWRWDAAQRAWVMLESTINTRLYRVSASIDVLTAYVLAAPPKTRVWLPWVQRSP